MRDSSTVPTTGEGSLFAWKNEGHHWRQICLNAICVPWPRSSRSFAMTIEISTIGGWSQLFLTPYGSASVLTADVPGHHQRELKQGTSLFWSSAKRSTVCGPKPRSVESNCCLESE